MRQDPRWEEFGAAIRSGLDRAMAGWSPELGQAWTAANDATIRADMDSVTDHYGCRWGSPEEAAWARRCQEQRAWDAHDRDRFARAVEATIDALCASEETWMNERTWRRLQQLDDEHRDGPGIDDLDEEDKQ